MNKYFAIKTEQGRYLKRNGGWCDDLKGATYGTEAQMRGMIEQKKNSPFYKGMTLEPLGEDMSGWLAKLHALRNKPVPENIIKQNFQQPEEEGIMVGELNFRTNLKGVLGELAASKCKEIIKGGEL